MAEAIRVNFTLAPKDIDLAAQEVSRQLKRQLDAVVVDAKAIGRRIGEALSAGISEGFRLPNLKAQIQAASGGIGAGAGADAGRQAGAATASFLDRIKAANEAIVKAGRDAAKSFAQGLNSGAGEAQKAGVTLGKSIEEGVRSSLQMRSPSKILYNLGFQAGVSFAQGFKAAQQQIQPIRASALVALGDLRETGARLQSLGVSLLGLTGLLAGLGAAAVRSAIDIDRQVNTLKVFTGSAEAAEKRLSELIATSQRTPGLTTKLALTLDAQLRVANVTEQTINRILPAIGKLNAISPLADPQRFVQNLVQLVTQNFEKVDLKELVGQSPFAGELIKNLFRVDSPTNSEAIRESARKLGLTTTDAFFAAFAQAAANNPKLAAVTESLGTQIDKLQDRLAIAIRPLGVQLLQAIVPAVERLVPVIEDLLKAFASLSPTTQTAIIALAGFATVIGPLAIAAGGVLQTAAAFGTLTTVVKGLGPALAEAQVALATANPVLLGLIALIGLATAAWLNYETAAEQAAKITAQSIQEQGAVLQQNQALAQQMQSLSSATGDSAEQHAKLNAVLNQLNPTTRIYINSLTDEEAKLKAIREEIAKIGGEGKDALLARFRILAAGAAETAAKIEELRQANKLASAEINQIATAPAGSLFKLVPGLATRNINELSAAIEKTNQEIERLTKTQSESEAKLLSVGNFLNLNRNQFEELTRSVVGNEARIQALLVAFDDFQAKQGRAAGATANTTSEVDRQRAAIDALKNSIAKFDFKPVEDTVNDALNKIKATAKDRKDALLQLEQLRKNDPVFRFAEQEKKRLKDVTEVLDIATGDKKAPKGSRAPDALRDITREVTKLRQEVEALEKGNVAGRIGQLFEKELERSALQDTKQQLTEIVKLRRQLDQDVRAALPTTKQGREEELRNLNREKQTREQILKLQDAQADAEAKLRVARAAATAPIVDAATRAATQIAEAQRARREAVEQSSADTIVALERINQLEAAHTEIVNEAFIAEQARAVKSIAASKELLAAEEARARFLAQGELAITAAREQARADRLKDVNDARSAILKNEAALAEGLIDLELDIQRARSAQALERLRTERNTALQIKLSEEEIAKLRAGDPQAVGRVTKDAQLQRDQERLRTLKEIVELQRQSAGGGFGGDQQLREDTLLEAQRNRLQQQRDLTKEVITLQDQIAHAGENAAERQQIAYLKSIRAIQEADEAAIDSMIRSRVELADKSIFHADRANARVLEHLAQQTKGITEIVSDSKIRLIDSVFEAADRGIAKLTERLGVFRDFVQEILSGLARMILSKAFQLLFGLNTGGAGSFGRGGGGGGFNVGSFLNFGGGGGGFGSFGPFTPPFAGGSIPGLPGGGGFGGIGGGGFNPLNLLGRIPGLRNLFGAGSNAAALQRLGGIPLTADFGGAGGVVGIPGAGAGAFGSLGSLGLLAGGGILGSLAGRGSGIGQLLGGVGGTLLGGVAGASGIFGGGLAAALPAFFTNPITAIIGGALIGGALLAGLFKDRDLKSYRKLIQGEYAVDVKEKEILKQIREIGKQTFGKDYKKHQIETIRLKQAKEIIAAYAEQTGQQGNGKLLLPSDRAALQDPFDPRNRFIFRQTGGIVPGLTRGRDHVLAMLDGGEFVVNARAVRQLGEMQLAALNAGRARIIAEDTSARLNSRSGPRLGFQTGGLVIGGGGGFQLAPARSERSEELDRSILGLLAELQETLGRLRGIPAGQLVAQGNAENPDASANAVALAFDRRTDASNRIRDRVNSR